MKAKSTSKIASTSSLKSNWQNNKSVTKLKDEAKSKNSFAAPKGKMEINSSFRSRDIKCLRRQGVGHIASQCKKKKKRAMILLDNGDIKSESSSVGEMPPLGIAFRELGLLITCNIMTSSFVDSLLFLSRSCI